MQGDLTEAYREMRSLRSTLMDRTKERNEAIQFAWRALGVCVATTILHYLVYRIWG